MKTCALLALLGLAAAAPAAFASTNVSYTATADPNASPDGLDNTGTPTDVWQLTYSGTGTTPANYGSFLGNSGGNGGGSTAGAGTSAWGLYASGGTTGNNEVQIGHTLTGGMLSLGQTVSIQFDGGYVDSGNQYGIRLFGQAGFALSLSFVGGDSSYRYYDASSNGANPGFSYTPNGFTFSYTQLTATTYRATVVGQDENVAWNGTVSSAPTFIQVYNANAGAGGNYDVFSNNLSIVPEPRTVAFLGLGLGLAFLRWRRRLA